MWKAASLPVLTALALADCARTRPPDGLVCTTEARASVQVRAVDTRDRPVPGVRVTYRLEGGPEQEAQCTSPEPGAACSTWVAEYERTGTFALTAVSPDGAQRVVAETTVQRDPCHVVTQQVRLVLPEPPGTPPPPGCTRELRPSVRVEVVDVRGLAVDVPQVTYRVDGGAEQRAGCESRDARGACLQWTAGLDEVGAFRLDARTADGRRGASALTTVVRNACHVLTQDVRLVLPD